jgi:hypothetical protein
VSPKYCSLAVDDTQLLSETLDNEFTPELKVVINQCYATLSEASSTLCDVVAISGKITVSF